MSISTESDSTSTPSEDDLPIVEVDQEYYVLIPSRFPPIELYERIANDPEHDAAFKEVEALTNPRLREKARLVGGSGPGETEPAHLQNWNHAPFTYPNPDGTRFFGPATAALELFDELQTALAVSVRKREAFLSSTNEVPMGLDMRVLVRRVTGRFADCRGRGVEPDREVRWRAGRALLEKQADGLLFRPEERPSATGNSILRGQALGRAIQGDHFRFAWDGERVKSLYAFRDGVVVLPESLGVAKAAFAA